MDFSAWLSDVAGRRVGNGQCWGLAQDFATRVVGAGNLNTQVGPDVGYAGNVWNGYGNNGVEQWFTQASPDTPAMPAWLAVWGHGPFTPFTHIAVTIKDGLYMTQNPGPAISMAIPKVGLLGYLVPRNGTGVQNALDWNDVKPYAPWDPNPAPKTSPQDWYNGLMDSFKPLLAFSEFMSKAGEWLSSAENWKRIGVFLLGAILLTITLGFMLKSPIEKVVSNV